MSGYVELLPVAFEAVGRGAEAMRGRSPGSLTVKGDRDLVSELDFTIERELRAFLRHATPAIGFLGEEEGSTGSAELQWVLDPIDGTANFVRGIPLCAVSLGLVHRDDAVLGVIELPFLGSRYAAARGDGASLNGQSIKASTVEDLSEAIVAIGDYAVGPDASAKNRLRLALTARLAEKAQRVRMTGSAALDLAWLAEGRIDAALTLSNHAWDMAAGVAIAREAGASVVDRDGTSHDALSAMTIAAAPALSDTLLTLLAKADSQQASPGEIASGSY
ncbi:inositol monophosphatase family protein [Micromonospora rubida]|uniref:inositol monophosphatase family protein n=1 Tax=Micromonospora rubida TaxID=2697657 RepID=UPI001376A13A|nr:inositol monophosphatase family protein [Micromonospora rubida]NBE81655.1 inositol monophosphatase [Micromonospora rubida]